MSNSDTEKQQPAQNVVMRALDTLKPYLANARTHPEKQIARLADGIKTFGWTVPCVIAKDGELLAGHGRLMAAERLGLAEVPCVVVDGWSEAQRKAYRIAENRVAEMSDWDEGLLAAELASLKELDRSCRSARPVP